MYWKLESLKEEVQEVGDEEDESERLLLGRCKPRQSSESAIALSAPNCERRKAIQASSRPLARIFLGGGKQVMSTLQVNPCISFLSAQLEHNTSELKAS